MLSIFLFPGVLLLLLLVLVDPHAVLPRVSIRTLSEPLGALCRMGSEGEVDAASFRPALWRPNATRSHRDAGFGNGEHDSDPQAATA